MRLDDGRCLIQTVDFFTPVVDDPWTFGAIAAANALSDVYAMGGVPLTALNILCWDPNLPEEILHHILRGGADKVREAGALLVGGHSVKAPELKFGCSVTGTVDEDGIWANAGARVGEVLVLTKPLGTGILNTAVKREQCPDHALQAATAAMLELNRAAADRARGRDVGGCTDVTGFGLAGHAYEIARASRVRLALDFDALPLLPLALELAGQGFVTGGGRDNRKMVGDALDVAGLSDAQIAVLCDPQTSGGLLISLPQDQAAGVGPIVGRVEAGEPALVVR